MKTRKRKNKKGKAHVFYGVTNLCGKSSGRLKKPPLTSKYVLFCDFDGVSVKTITKALGDLVKLPYLGDLFVFTSGIGHYWVISPTMLSVQQVLEALYVSGCDAVYAKTFFVYGRNSLRLSKKPFKESSNTLHFMGMFETKNSTKLVYSKKHYELALSLIGLDVDAPKRKMKNVGIEFTTYYIPEEMSTNDAKKERKI